VVILQQFYLLQLACEPDPSTLGTPTVKGIPNTGGAFLPVFNDKHNCAPSNATLIKTRHFSLKLFSVILFGLAHSNFVHSLKSDNPDPPGECMRPAKAEGITYLDKVNDQRSHADLENANYDGTSPLQPGLWQLVKAASILPTKPLLSEDTQEETESFTVPPLLMMLLLATCILGATLGALCTLTVQKLGRLLSNQTRTRLPGEADRPPEEPTQPDPDSDTSRLLHTQEEGRESRLPNNRQTLTWDVGVQTGTPGTTPVHTLNDSQCVWVSGAGERFHFSQNCRGLRAARHTFCKTRCLICG
jgi:hypothetical protein